jgi:hypothetical protein
VAPGRGWTRRWLDWCQFGNGAFANGGELRSMGLKTQNRLNLRLERGSLGFQGSQGTLRYGSDFYRLTMEVKGHISRVVDDQHRKRFRVEFNFQFGRPIYRRQEGVGNTDSGVKAILVSYLFRDEAHLVLDYDCSSNARL